MCVRECEELLKCVQRSRDLRVAYGCKPPDWSTCAKHARSWSVVLAVHYRTKVLGWPGRLLAAWTCDSTQSRGQAARTPYLAKYDVSHSFSPYFIYTLIPMIPRELPERILREKPKRKQDWLIHNLYLRDSSNSSTLFLWSLRGSLLKPFLTISIPVEGYLVFWEAVRKEPISYWLMLWSSSGIQEARKEIGSA